MERRKKTKIGTHACHGAGRVWKKFWLIWRSWKKNVFRTCPPVDPKVPVAHGVHDGMHEMTPNFGIVCACPLESPRQD